MPQMGLEEEYLWALNKPRDLHEHLEYLRELASSCTHVTEFGIGVGMSDRAFLAGLQRDGCSFIAYDIFLTPEAKRLCGVAGLCKYIQIQANVLQVAIERTELLFIDTLHNCEQLRAELWLHHTKVDKYLVMHDTVTFGLRDECPSQSGPNCGLLAAISEFVRSNPCWTIKSHRLNCNGLITLQRVA